MTDVPHAPARPTRLASQLDVWWLVSIASVLVATLLASVYSPDLVSGSSQEHVALPAIVDWLWAAVAIGYLSYVGRGRTDPTLAVSVGLLWAAVAVASIFAPEIVTGTDPTRIPIAALVTPVGGAVMTGFLCLHALQHDAQA